MLTLATLANTSSTTILYFSLLNPFIVASDKPLRGGDPDNNVFMEGLIVATNYKMLMGSSVLAVLLTACGGGGGSDYFVAAKDDPAAEGKALPPEQVQIIDESNDFTSGGDNPEQGFCPETASTGVDGLIDATACLAEANQQDPFILTASPYVQAYCPEAADANNFSASGEFHPEDLSYDVDFDGTVTFPVACLTEAANNFYGAYSDLFYTNPLTEEFCPEHAATVGNPEEFSPEACILEAANSFSQNVPGKTYVMSKFCPEQVDAEFSPTLATDCITDAAQLYFSGFFEFFTASNPVTETFCPISSEGGSIDPATCLIEALEDGQANIQDGLDAGDLLNYFCPVTANETSLAGSGPDTAYYCLEEAFDHYKGMEAYLRAPNPLTEAFCPDSHTASGIVDTESTGLIDPAACLEEAIFDGGAAFEEGISEGMALFCPMTAAGELGAETPFACFQEASAHYFAYSEFFKDLLDRVLGDYAQYFDPSNGTYFGEGAEFLTANPLVDLICPSQSGSSFDPAGCFQEGASLLSLIDTGDYGLFENCSLVDLGALSGDVTEVLGLGCLLEQASTFQGNGFEEYTNYLSLLSPDTLQALLGSEDLLSGDALNVELLSGLLTALSSMSPEELQNLQPSALEALIGDLLDALAGLSPTELENLDAGALEDLVNGVLGILGL